MFSIARVEWLAEPLVASEGFWQFYLEIWSRMILLAFDIRRGEIVQDLLQKLEL